MRQTTITPDNRAAVLAGHPVFAKLPDEQRRSLARAMGQHEYRAGQPVFQAGDPADRLYLIVSGAVRIVRLGEDGRETLLNFVRANDILGEIALLDNRTRTASAIAHTDCRFLSLSRETFHELLANPSLAAGIFTVLVDRLRHMSELLHHSTLRGVGARVAFVLGLLADRHGHRCGNGDVEIALKISDEDIAIFAHTSRPSANKAISRLRQKGVVARSGRRLVVRDRAELDRAVHAEPARSPKMPAL